MEISGHLDALVKESPVPIEQETGWAPRAGWALWVYIKNSLPLPRIEPRFLGQTINLDSVSEVRLVCRALCVVRYAC